MTINNDSIILDNSNYLLNSFDMGDIAVDCDGKSREEMEDDYRFYMNRDIELRIVDAEREIEELPMLISDQHTAMQESEVTYKMYPSKRSWNEFQTEASELWRLENRLDYLNKYLVETDSRDEITFDVDDIARDDDPILGQSIHQYLQIYSGQLSATELNHIWQHLIILKTDGDISWKHYVNCGIGCLSRLVQLTSDRKWVAQEWQVELDKLLANRKKYQTPNHVAFDEKYSGNMSVDMEPAIDYMRHVRHMAKTTGMTELEVVQMLDQ